MRPSVDVVVPFAGTERKLELLLERLGRIRLAPGDTLVVADNRPAGAALSFRLRRAGWDPAARPGARVTHDTRATLKALVRQRARHGSGCAWLNSEYPGTFPPSPLPGLTWWTVQRLGAAGRELARG